MVSSRFRGPVEIDIEMLFKRQVQKYALASFDGVNPSDCFDAESNLAPIGRSP